MRILLSMLNDFEYILFMEGPHVHIWDGITSTSNVLYIAFLLMFNNFVDGYAEEINNSEIVKSKPIKNLAYYFLQIFSRILSWVVYIYIANILLKIFYIASHMAISSSNNLLVN